ncbi:hypothetical protein AB0O80_10580 [Rothia kristinae]|uniref:hypothetical protein n=1 Tax=Actinomycetes TaxID=1760 RepID=UPI003438D157
MAVVIINEPAVRAYLRDESVRKALADRAQAVAAEANRVEEGYESEAIIGRKRALARVWTDTPEAARSERIHHTLERAQEAGRRA